MFSVGYRKLHLAGKEVSETSLRREVDFMFGIYLPKVYVFLFFRSFRINACQKVYFVCYILNLEILISLSYFIAGLNKAREVSTAEMMA